MTMHYLEQQFRQQGQHALADMTAAMLRACDGMDIPLPAPPAPDPSLEPGTDSLGLVSIYNPTEAEAMVPDDKLRQASENKHDLIVRINSCIAPYDAAALIFAIPPQARRKTPLRSIRNEAVLATWETVMERGVNKEMYVHSLKLHRKKSGDKLPLESAEIRIQRIGHTRLHRLILELGYRNGMINTVGLYKHGSSPFDELVPQAKGTKLIRSADKIDYSLGSQPKLKVWRDYLDSGSKGINSIYEFKPLDNEFRGHSRSQGYDHQPVVTVDEYILGLRAALSLIPILELHN